MTYAECEIVANVAVQLRVRRDLIWQARPSWSQSPEHEALAVETLNELSYLIGALSALPLEAEV